MRPSTEAAFFSRVQGADPNGCWLWMGSRTPNGYGSFRAEPAYRWCWKFFFGDIPDGLCLDHLCVNPPCVNPWHLDPVTPQVNSRRYMKRLPPERRPKIERVERELRAMLASYSIGQQVPSDNALAKHFKVGHTTAHLALSPLFREGAIAKESRRLLRKPSLEIWDRYAV